MHTNDTIAYRFNFYTVFLYDTLKFRIASSLPDYLRNPTLSIDVFKRYLKTFYLLSALETLCF